MLSYICCLIIACLWKALSRLTSYRWYYDLFFLSMSFSSCKNYLKVDVVCISIKANTRFQYVLNPKMEIPTTHEILLLRLMLCVIVLFFGATYTITLFIDSFFCVSNICSNYFRNLSVWNGKIVFLRRLYSWFLFCLQQNSSSLLLYVFPSSDALVLKHYSALQLSWLLNMCSRGTLLASLNSSIFFPILFYRVPPTILESESICFGASTLPIPTFVDDGKDVLSYKLHVMRGICK